MSTLISVPTTVKLWRLNPSFLTMNGRFSLMDGGSSGWMSWKWLSTATETNWPVVTGGVVTSTIGRSENAGDGLDEGVDEQAARETMEIAAATRASTREPVRTAAV